MKILRLLIVILAITLSQPAFALLSTSDNTATYTGNASTTDFSFPYLFYADSDLAVTVDGVTKTLTTDYTVSGTGDSGGGTVTFLAAPAASASVIIQRIVPYTQGTDFSNFDGNPADVTEKQFDLEAMMAQQNKDLIDRSLKFPAGDTKTSELPSATSRANKALIFDASGNVTVSSGDFSTIETNISGITASVASAAASSSSASSSASSASSSASTATTQAAAALASASASAVSAATLAGTSTSSVTIATGSKSFTTQSGKQFASNQLCISSSANSANYMHGNATSYTGTALTVNVADTGGSGTLSDWVISVCGTRGTTGSTGATGAQGPAGASGSGRGDMLAAQNLADLANDSTSRTNLGLGTIATQNSNNVTITGGSVTGITDIAVADGGTGSSTAAAARTALGLAIGTDVQAYDGELAALAGLTSAADKLPYFTGSGTAAVTSFTAAGRALIDDADAAAQRTTLGLGSVATLTAGTSANNVVQLDGSAKLPAVDGSQLTGVGSGAFTLITSHTASASTSLDFTGLSSSCSAYKFVIVALRPASDGAVLYFRTSTDGGSTYAAAAGNYIWQQSILNGTSGSVAPSPTFDGSGTSTRSTYLAVTDYLNGSDSAASQVASGEAMIYDPANAVAYKMITVQLLGFPSAGNFQTVTTNGYRASTADVDAVRFIESTGNITSGTIYEYCLKSS